MNKILLAAAVVGFIGLGCGDDTSATGGSGGTAGTGGTAGHGGSGGSGGTGGTGGSGGIDAPMIDAPMVDGEVDGGVDGNPNDITGSFIEQFITDNAVTAVPEDLSGVTPAASIGSTTYNGTGMADGTFVIPNVPFMEYRINLYSFFITDARVLDLGYDFLGRADTVAPTMAMNLVLNISGMDAWNAQDAIEVYSANGATIVQQGATGSIWPTFTSGAPAAGNTSLTNATIDWVAQGGNLIQGTSKGDHLTVEHFHLLASGTTTAWGLTRSLTTNQLEMTDGQNATLTGAFTTPTTAQATFDWKNSQWNAAIAGLNLGGGTAGQDILLQAQPSASTHGWTSATAFIAPDLLFVFRPGTTNTDSSAGPFTYGNPFAAPYDVIGIAIVGGSRTYTLAGTTTGAREGADVLMVNLLAGFTANPVQPLVTSPSALMANGTAINTDVTLASATPTLSWTAPSSGNAQLYYILLYELTASGTTTTRTFRHQYRTNQTSMTFPAGHLVSGHKYFVKVTAQTATGVNLKASPNRWHLPFGFADTLSGILTVP